MIYLQETTRSLYLHTKKRFEEGKIRQHIRVEGQLVLMLDKLDRLLAGEGDIEKEIQDMASDALVALWCYVSDKIEREKKLEENDDEDR